MSDISKRVAALTPEERAALVMRLMKKGVSADFEGEKKIPRRKERGDAPLSYSQQRLWFLAQLESGSSFYNFPSNYRLVGTLDVDVLKRCINEIIMRHESLRTNFIGGEIQPVQRIATPRQIEVPVVDLRSLDARVREQELQSLAAREARKPFNLEEDGLIRVMLVRVADDEHVIIIIMHHIISDAWSMGVFVDELAALYEAFIAGRPSPLPELPIQYADYAVWQRELLEGEPLARQLNYWRKQLGGRIPALRLPTDFARPSLPTFSGSYEYAELPSDLTAKVRALCQREGVTIFMLLLAAFKTLLYRYTRQIDLTIGTPIAGRNHTELEKLIGLFVNTIVIRTNLQENPTFLDLLHQVKETTLEAQANQDVPFDHLVDELQIEHTLSQSPLFQVMFGLQNTPLENKNMASGLELKMNALEIDTRSSKFDLSVSLEEVDDIILGFWEYRTDLFKPSTIARMIGHYRVLIEGITANPTQRIDDLPLLSHTEREQLLAERNDTTRSYALPSCIHELFEEQVERRPDACAITFEGASLTYRELNARANQLARYLRHAGVGAEVKVGLFVERSLEMVVGILGVLKAGGAYLPLDPAYPPERTRFMIEDAAVSILFTQEHLIAALPRHHAKVVCLDADWPSIARESEDNLSNVANPLNLAYVIYTSGSTGKPKGVLVSHANVQRLMAATDAWFNFNESDVWTLFHSYAFDFSVWELWGALLYGGRLVVVSYWVSRTPQAFYELLRDEGVTVLNQTPSAFRQLMQVNGSSDNIDALSLRYVIFGGEALDLSSLKPWFERHGDVRPRLVNMYGITETTVHVTYRPLTATDAHGGTRSLIGGSIPDLSVYVLDKHLEYAPVGVAGEMYVGGDGVSRGYLNRPELTSERFIPDPFGRQPGARLYRTGDLACRLSNGDIEYLGRLDNQVKIRGFRIEVGEIETALMHHPSIHGAAVKVHEDAAGEKRLVAYIVSVDGEPQLVGELRDYLKRFLPDYMLPSVFMTLDALPLTPNGKVDRQALPEPEWLRPKLAVDYVAPRSLLEMMLAEMWQKILDVEKVGVHDNFFELGGDSIQAAIFINNLQRKLGHIVHVVAIFDAPTVATLAAYLTANYADIIAEVSNTKWVEQGLGQSGTSLAYRLKPIQSVPREGRRNFPLSFAQQRLWFIDRMELESPFYNIPDALRLTGHLDVAALEESLNEILRRHEALRTTFDVVNGEPSQIINEPGHLPLHLTELNHLPPVQAEAEAIRLTVEESRQPFDLTRAPLMRAQLLRIAAEEHILLLTMHHIAADGWSMGVFVRELTAHYESRVTGQPVSIPPLPIQYVDFAVWQREWLSGEVLEQQLAYWKERLGGELPTLDLPTDRPRPPLLTYRGDEQLFELSVETTAKLRALGTREGTTLFITLLAAFQTLLLRYTGQTDLILGVPIAGRNREELENLIGFFVNTLVIRNDLSGNPSFKELLARVREVALGAYEHQEMPFERLVEELQPERDMSRNPIIQVMFAFQNATLGDYALRGLEVRPVEVGNDVTRFDIEFHLWEHDGGLGGRLFYNVDLFDAATIARMIAHFKRLLEAIAEDSTTRLFDLPMLGEAERAQLLAGWNDTHCAYPHDECVHELFSAQAARTPDAEACIYGDARITYGELERRSNKLANYLRARGVGTESLVGIMVERSIEMIVGMLGVLKAGGAYVPLDLNYPKSRLQMMIEDTGMRVLLCAQSRSEAFAGSGVETLPIDTLWSQLERENADKPHNVVSSENLAYVIYTSGSTGKPKGVCVSHRAINRLIFNTNYVRLDANCRIAQASNAAFDAATFEIWGALLHGGTLVGVKKDTVLSPLEFAAQIAKQRINTLFLTTALFNQMASLAPHAFASLRYLLFGGEAVEPRWVREVLLKGAPQHLLHVYGPTENTTFSSWYPVNEVSQTATTVPIGLPVSNTQIHVLDAALQPVPVGVAGELYVGGDGLARDYLNRPALTAEKFLPDPFAQKAGARLYRTGDRVRRLPDGAIEFLSRVDNQVKVRGFRIELGEIETALSEHEEVRDCIVVAHEDEQSDRRIVAYVVPETKLEHEAPLAVVDDLRSDQVSHWQKIFDDHIYNQPVAQPDPTFNIIGWNSNYTDAPIPAAEMRVWLEDTLAPIRDARPRRVLEIGCGTGLLLTQIAPHCETYLGTDVSRVALDYIERLRAQMGESLSRVTLSERAADDFSGLEPQTFDAVILNSVVQYFPDINYLTRVIEGAARVVAPGGFIFLGDVRSLPLLEAFHASVQLFKAEDNLKLPQLQQRVRKRVAQENELTVDPAFFFALKRRLPEVAWVEVFPKRGFYHNELTRFRYQVVLRIDAQNTVKPQAGDVRWLDWEAANLTPESLRRLLVEARPDLLGLVQVPNARLGTESKLLELLRDEESELSIEELKRLIPETKGIDPEEFFALADELSYTARLSWARHGYDGRFDVLFSRHGLSTPETVDGLFAFFPEPERQEKALGDYANNPLRSVRSRQLVPRLRDYLQERLPDYMIPAAFVVMESLPLNANGKVNRRALPPPETIERAVREDFAAPRTPAEEKIGTIWSEVLGVKQVGINDNFFDIGGHSLMATQVVSRISDAFLLDLPLRILFESPTVAGLALAVVQKKAEHADDETLAQALTELENLPDEEVQALLAQASAAGGTDE